jgi:putative acetyltransferase
VSDTLTTRSATNADGDQIQRLVFGILDEYKLSPDINGTDADIADIEANYLGRGGVFEVVENENGTIVGTIGLYPLNETTIELRKMYLHPSIRGQGLGKKLLERIIKRARELGYLRVYLETASILKAAVHLYESAGFRPVQERHTARCDQAYVLELSEK